MIDKRTNYRDAGNAYYTTSNNWLHRDGIKVNTVAQLEDTVSEPESISRVKLDGVIGMSINDEIEVQNAGVVLAAPYLLRLFKMNGLLRDGVFKADKDKAVGRNLVNYVSYGDYLAAQCHPLTNLLCNSDPTEMIDPGDRLSDAQIQSVDDMLWAIIQCWCIGNTSVDGLRSSFITREGRLQKSEQGWKLLVAPSVFDVLLDRLPWSYTVIRYRWMEEIIHVHWR